MPIYWGLRLGPLMLLGLLCLGGILFFVVGGKPGIAPLQPIGGKVTYRGMPLQTGLIVFTPDAARGNGGSQAIGQIRADGTYSLKTGEAAGIAAGFYRVTVASVSTSTSAANQGYIIPASFIPEKYRDPELSSLTCEIKTKSTSIDFDLD